MVARRIFVSLLFLVAAQAQAATLNVYTFDASKSSLTFEAVQNHATVKGAFTRFNGWISFSPDLLAQSKVTVTIDLDSVAADYDKVPSTLKTPDWFDAVKFPKATFEAHDFSALGGKQYAANGTLTLKGKTMPLTVQFTLDDFRPGRAAASGTATVKRTTYHVGWDDTASVEDAVKVTFSISADAKK